MRRFNEEITEYLDGDQQEVERIATMVSRPTLTSAALGFGYKWSHGAGCTDRSGDFG